MLNNRCSLAIAALVALTLANGPALADPCDGEQNGVHSVAAGGSSPFSQCFRAGEWARITVVGDGSTDLDVYVYDSYGNLITMDEGPSDRSSLTFFVSTTQSYRVVVVNRGLVWNQFAIRAD